MQVKKYQASSILEALHQVKKELGPDAIILSTQEGKRTLAGKKNFIVVAAVSENQLKRKEIAEQKLGDLFEKEVQTKSAAKQKLFIDSAVGDAERRYRAKNKKITSTPYIDIGDEGVEAKKESVVTPVAAPVLEKSADIRVKNAAAEAFQSGMGSLFFEEEPKPPTKPIFQKVVTPQKPREERSQILIEASQKLAKCGVNTELIQQLERRVMSELGPQAQRKAIVDSWFAKWILQNTTVASNIIAPSVEIFIGPHGSGKTTSLIKMATFYKAQSNQSVAIVTTDTTKVGSFEQLKVYSRILNVPIYVANQPDELAHLIPQLEQFDKVLVDTPGVSMGSLKDLDFVIQLTKLQSTKKITTHLVLSALTKAEDLSGVL
ncbi:MAG: hypothetical protein AAF203_09170, partial [Pseudomonadota bacterium]